jgi:hypothetical protein
MSGDRILWGTQRLSGSCSWHFNIRDGSGLADLMFELAILLAVKLTYSLPRPQALGPFVGMRVRR